MTGIYARVSSRSQKVASQRREIERYLSANGMTEVRWFVDEGVTGAVMERPALDPSSTVLGPFRMPGCCRTRTYGRNRRPGG